MKSIFWGNYKGGVGKTTSVFQVGSFFATQGKRVLLIDLDPQCSLSNICCNSNGEQTLEQIEVESTLNYTIELYMRYIQSKSDFDFQLLLGDELEKLKGKIAIPYIPLRKTEFKESLYFIPSTMRFENSRLNHLAQRMSQNVYNIFLIKLLMDELTDEFDYIFFDCPPTTNMLTQSVFLASDYYILPTICDEISTKGVADYIVEIESTRKRYELHDQIGGLMLQKVLKDPAQFIGVFGTIVKGKKGNGAYSNEMMNLDESINQIGVHSVVSKAEHRQHRYNGVVDGFSSCHIFKYQIAHKDDRTRGESIPKNTSQGEITPSYQELAKALLSIV